MENGSEVRKRVRLFALSTCATCKRVKEALAAMGVEFESIDVDTLESGEQWLMSKELKKYNPMATYPTIIIEEVMTEFDEERLRRTLGLGQPGTSS